MNFDKVMYHKEIEKTEIFLVNINIIEARHLVWPNMNSSVHVQVGNHKKCTAIQYHSDSPFFNEYFSFEFHTTFQIFIDKNITLTVFRPRTALKRRKTLGYVTLDLATVWEQSDHQFYHKWAILAAPVNDPTSAPRGYLKIDIHILRKGESPQIPAIETEDTDEIEGNLLLPEGLTLERQRANYIFNIYHGKNIMKPKHFESDSILEKKAQPNSYIEIHFAGLKGKTSIQKNSSNPTWNERLVLTELFPPLCQRVKIHLCQSDTFHESTSAVRYLNLRSISNDGMHGFLPTFGPAFVHFYSKNPNYEGYVGEVLISFRTELYVNAISTGSTIKSEPIQGITEVHLWNFEPILLCGVVLSANLINKRYRDKLVSFELNCGGFLHQKMHINGAGEGAVASNRTHPLKPLTKSKLHWYLEFGRNKPCFYVHLESPDFRKRLYHSNMITKIVEELKCKLDGVEALLAKSGYRNRNVEMLLLDIIDFLSGACIKYVDMMRASGDGYQTELDKERRKFCISEMENIEISLKTIQDPRMNRKCFNKLQKLYQKLELLVEDAQDCWADVFISMLVDNKIVGSRRITAKDLVYSPIDEEKGRGCGKVQHLFFPSVSSVNRCSLQSESDISCKLEIFLWMGLQRHKNACFDEFPSGFAFPEESFEFPTCLVAQEEHYFQCRVHVYQGKFSPGADKSGLCDPFARITVEGDSKQTTVIPATLTPTWDQTLIFKNLTLCGTKTHINNNPPVIVAEIFDQDECCKIEFIGRCTFTPVIKFMREVYTAPKFPPKMQWFKISKNEEVLGEILAAAEFLELNEQLNDTEVEPSDDIIQIPSDIKPNLVKYRIEMIFWGMRNLKKIHLLPITKPKIVLECGYANLHSDTIINANKGLNFAEPIKFIDVNLADQEAYFPPFILKVFDCRSFGRYTLAGAHVASIAHFLYEPLTKGERNKKLLQLPESSLQDIKHLRPKLTFQIQKDEAEKDLEIDCKSASSTKEANDIWYKRLMKLIHNWRRKRTTKDKQIEGDKDSESPASLDSGKETDTSRRLTIRKKKKEATACSTESDTNTESSIKACPYKIKRTKKGGKDNSSQKTNTSSESSSSKKKRKLRIKRSRKQSKEEHSSSRSRSESSSSSKKSRKKHNKNPKRKEDDLKISTAESSDSGEVTETTQLLRRKFLKKHKVSDRRRKNSGISEDSKENETIDWWTKYYASTEDLHTREAKANKTQCTLKIFLNELEAQPEFNEFKDYLQTFPMYKGKRTGDEAIDEEHITGIFKGALRIYRFPESTELEYVSENGLPLSDGIFNGFPSNEPLKFALRVYCIRGIELTSKDPNGRSDPYISIKMSNKVINDRENHLTKQLNPIFGRCFELIGTFPQDHTVTVSIWDWDLTSSDDLIGETRIDIENRFYTRHRAHCGLSFSYEKTGNCSWRNNEKPTQILENLCKKYNIELPVYTEYSVRILQKEFSFTYPDPNPPSSQAATRSVSKEVLALYALHHWQEVPLIGYHLVPEHVETRSLYHPAKPGIEQGKLQMWLDIFPYGDLPPPPKVDISPRKPVVYELRVIIWNTEDVILDEEDLIVGERMSDIYVKGWLVGPEFSQCTDVHYRSITGEGSFNWRFIFRFKYLSTENKLVMTKKESIFSVEETEFKFPCRLTLQVWDNDIFSPDDFLGIVVLELARLPRGAKTANTCTLKNIQPDAPTVNLFKIRRTRGWWPFRGVDVETKSDILAGKVEAEFELLTIEDADEDPVGLGRSEPHALPKPNRPDTSFSWFRNPLKALKFLVCKHYRWKIIKYLFCVMILIGIIVAVYSFPGYTVKKLLGV